MAQPFDPQNATNIYTKTNNDSSEDFDDGLREGSGSGTSNNKRSVTHIFVSQHALAALVLLCLLFILASLVARRGRRYYDGNLQESIEPEDQGGPEKDFYEDCNTGESLDCESKNIDLDNEVLAADMIIEEKDFCTVAKEERKHVTFIN